MVDTVDANGAEAAFTYDADGNLLSRRAATGRLASSTSTPPPTPMTTLTSSAPKPNQRGGTHAYHFYYDNRGNLRGTQYPNGTFSWTDTNPAGWTTDVLNRHGSIGPNTTSAPADPAPLADYGYQYNQDGQKIQEQRTTGSSSGGGTVQASGNEITDAVRAAGVQG